MVKKLEATGAHAVNPCPATPPFPEKWLTGLAATTETASNQAFTTPFPARNDVHTSTPSPAFAVNVRSRPVSKSAHVVELIVVFVVFEARAAKVARDAAGAEPPRSSYP